MTTLPQDKSQDTTLQELTHALFMLNGLGDQVAQERDLMATLMGRFTVCVSKSEALHEQLETLGSKTTHVLETTLQRQLPTLMGSLGQEAARVFSQQINTQLEGVSRRLHEACQKTTDQLTTSQKQLKSYFIALGMMLMVGIGLGVALTYWWMPKMPPYMNEKMKAGDILRQAWPYLNKKEQDKIMSYSSPQMQHKR